MGQAGGDPQRLRRIPAPGLAAQRPAQAFDLRGGPMIEIGQGAFADLGSFPEGLAQQHRGWRAAVGHDMDMHAYVYNQPTP